jgi:alpha-galactosidase
VAAGFNPGWDGEYYCLDISRPDVVDYLTILVDKVTETWGFRYLKLDFMYAGLLYGSYAAGGAPYEHYARACAALTAKTSTSEGAPVIYLGCGVPLGPSFRFFPLSRIGADTRETWDWWQGRIIGHPGRPSAWLSLRDTIGRSFMNGAVYLNDPDVVFLRSTACALTRNEKELVALVNFLLASQIMFSDDPARLTEADTLLTARINALYGELEGEEYGAVRIAADVFRLESRHGKIAGLINLDRKPFKLYDDVDAGLFAPVNLSDAIVCHWKDEGAYKVFEGHSISIWRKP